MAERGFLPRTLRILCYALPVLVFLLLWFPEVDHYYVPDVVISDSMLRAAREIPSDSILEELNSFRFFDRRWSDEKQSIYVAEKLLHGEVEIPGYPATTIRMPFDPRDMDQGLPSWQLELASLGVPRILLDAYELTGREEFFAAARDAILGWASYERRAWLPRGFLWNDHACAARVGVLADFWRLYRHRQDYRAEVARAVWQLAARTGEMLGKPSHFTFATNHGVMQNLALWHLCLAFPTLSGVERYKQLAGERLRWQMSFYIDAEGVVAEHSAFYHEFGLRLLSLAFRYMTLLDEPIPEDWREKYLRALKFYAQLRRPDGSLPMIGDTDGQKDPRGPRVARLGLQGRAEALAYKQDWIPQESLKLYPLAGYGVWWDGLRHWPDPINMSQTVFTWADHPGRAHKHADEMSVLFWAGGQIWWTNVGYWPYGVIGRDQAVGWSASNAPHLVGETADSTRGTRLLSYSASAALEAIEMERTGPGEYIARRQVLHLRPNIWVVVDNTSGLEQDRTITCWTTAANVDLRPGDISGSYTLSADRQALRIHAFLLGSPGMNVRLARGSRQPFAGWQVVEGAPREAAALILEQPAHASWSVLIWTVDDSRLRLTSLVAAPRLLQRTDGRNWEIVLPLASGKVTVRREGDRLWAGHFKGSPGAEAVTLVRAPDVSRQWNQLRDNYVSLFDKYHPFEDLLPFRFKVSYVMLLAFGLQEAFFAAYRWSRRKPSNTLRALALSGWTALGVWLLLCLRWG